MDGRFDFGTKSERESGALNEANSKYMLHMWPSALCGPIFDLFGLRPFDELSRSEQHAVNLRSNSQ